jgi:hypothetical protein
MTRASVSGANQMTTNGNAELGLHVFKRRASGQMGDRYTIGVWEGTCQRVICHDACIDGALTAIRDEMEKAGRSPVAPHREIQGSVSDTNT